ncbi:MAG: MBL fold metallo-hydrolase, partial [Thermoplasmata archaeon]|nr:MBL fold metallo-hydrolase [Thermoplasmata archaeon]
VVRPACDIEKFDFSAHAGHSDLVKLVEATRAKTVVLMHGDDRAKLAASLEGTVQVLMPQNGEKMTL